jgi:Protein of unknown function (DUF402)
MKHAEIAFVPGSTAVRRDIFRGQVWTATPFRVVSDSSDLLAMAIWPGVEGLAPTHQADLTSPRRDETVRNVALPNLAAGRWELAAWTWESTTKLTLLVPGAYFSVDLYFHEPGDNKPGGNDPADNHPGNHEPADRDPGDHEPAERDPGDLVMWYVNFERPFRRTPIGIDTFDLLLDLVIEPDASHRWKDEGEYAQARQLGIVTDDEHRHVQLAREQVLGLLDQRTGPFDQRWRFWRREPHWQLPTLAVDASDLGGRAHTPHHHR